MSAGAIVRNLRSGLRIVVVPLELRPVVRELELEADMHEQCFGPQVEEQLEYMELGVGD